MEEDVAVIVCGGAAKNAFGIIDSKDRDTRELYEEAEKDFGHHFDVISDKFSTIPKDDPEEMERALEGKRIVVPFLILGGEVGTGIIRDVIRCARSKDCKVVSVFGIPMGFEAERRERAFRNLTDVVALSDCSLVADMQKLMDVNLELNKERLWTTFLSMSDGMIRSSIASIVEFMQGPFFSVFTESMYAFVPSTDVIPLNAVIKSWDHLMFDTGRATDTSVIMLGSTVRSSEIKEIEDRVAMLCGTVPQIVIRSDPYDSKVIIFRAVRSF